MSRTEAPKDFGLRRAAQLCKERPHLVYVHPAEADLLATFRHARPAAQRRIITSAKTLADDDPASTAGFHMLKGAQP